MFVETRNETITRKLRHLKKPLQAVSYLYVYKCDHCARIIECHRLDGEGKPMVPFACVCRHLVSIN